VGEHAGLARYTVGQRRGLGIATSLAHRAGARSRPGRARPELLARGSRGSVARTEIVTGPCTGIRRHRPAPAKRSRCRFAIADPRFAGACAPKTARISASGRGRARGPLRAVTPGQSVVFITMTASWAAPRSNGRAVKDPFRGR
jgi:tRNA U34 2-thiouridine synthase MnmA/TrmU